MTRPPRGLAAVAAGLLVLGACSGGGEEATDPTPSPAPSPTVTAAAVPSELVRFATPDGVELEATVWGEGPAGVVLAHMRGRDRSTWAAFAETAAADGYQVMTFDFRGYGGSTGERDTALDTDLVAAVDLLRARGAEAVVVVGASMGGTAAVNVAARIDLAGAAALSAPADFQGLPALAVAGDVGEPLLLVTAEGDQPYADAALAMAEAAPVSQLQILDGNAHGTNLFADHDEVLTQSLLDFIGERLPQAS